MIKKICCITILIFLGKTLFAVELDTSVELSKIFQTSNFIQRDIDQISKEKLSIFFDKLRKIGLWKQKKLQVFKNGALVEKLSIEELREKVLNVKFHYSPFSFPGLSPVSCWARSGGIATKNNNVVISANVSKYDAITWTSFLFHEAIGALGINDGHYQITSAFFWFALNFENQNLSDEEISKVFKAVEMEPLREIQYFDMAEMKREFAKCIQKEDVQFSTSSPVQVVVSGLNADEYQIAGGFGVDGGGDPQGVRAKIDLLLYLSQWEPRYFFQEFDRDKFVKNVHRVFFEFSPHYIKETNMMFFCQIKNVKNELYGFLGFRNNFFKKSKFKNISTNPEILEILLEFALSKSMGGSQKSMFLLDESKLACEKRLDLKHGKYHRFEIYELYTLK